MRGWQGWDGWRQASRAFRRGLVSRPGVQDTGRRRRWPGTPGQRRANEDGQIGTPGDASPGEPKSSDGFSEGTRSQSAVINSSVATETAAHNLIPFSFASSLAPSFSRLSSTPCSTSPQSPAPQSGRCSGWPQAWPPPLSPSARPRSPCPVSSPTHTSTTSASRTPSPSSAIGVYCSSGLLATRPPHPAVHPKAQASPDPVRKDCVRSPRRPSQPGH